MALLRWLSFVTPRFDWIGQTISLKKWLPHEKFCYITAIGMLASLCSRDSNPMQVMLRFEKEGLYPDTLEEMISQTSQKAVQAYLASICQPGGFQNMFATRALLMASDWEEKSRWDIKEWQELSRVTVGLGQKCCTILILLWWGTNDGMSVDTHVMFVSNVLGVAQGWDQNRIRITLEKLLPRDKWADFNNVCGGLCQALFQSGENKRQEVIEGASHLGQETIDLVSLLLAYSRLQLLERTHSAVAAFVEMLCGNGYAGYGDGYGN